jgi:hypothetical protein
MRAKGKVIERYNINIKRIEPIKLMLLAIENVEE